MAMMRLSLGPFDSADSYDEPKPEELEEPDWLLEHDQSESCPDEFESVEAGGKSGDILKATGSGFSPCLVL